MSEPAGTGTLDVAVIGGGIVGMSTAERLRRDGHRVLLFDRIPPGSPDQASYGNAGVLTPSSMIPVPVPGLVRRLPRLLLAHDSPLFLRWRTLPQRAGWLGRFLAHARTGTVERTAAALAPLIADAPSEHLDLARGTPAETFLRFSDMACLYPDAQALRLDQAWLKLRERHDIRVDILDRAALAARDPELSPNYRVGACFPDHGYITDPGGYVAALARHFVRRGGTVIRAGVEALDPTGSGSVVVHAGGAQRTTDRVVICAGIDSDRWMGRFGHNARLESERGYHIMLRGAAPVPPIPYILADARAALTPMQDGLRLAGLVEFARRGAPPSRKPVAYLHRMIRRVYPELRWESETSWMGNRPTTVDSLPVLGASPDFPSVFFAFGTHHVGMTSGARIGRWMADLVGGRRPNLDLTPYRVDRFGPVSPEWKAHCQGV